MTLTYKVTHIQEAFDRLMEQLKSVSAFETVLRILNTQTQELEDAFQALFTQRTLTDAVGEQLDVLGRILGEPRAGFSDDDYRHRLSAKIRILRSSGSAHAILDAFKLLLPNNNLRFEVMGGAGFIFNLGLINTDFLPIYQRFIRKAKSAGINAQLVYQTVDDATSFWTDWGSTLTVGASPGNTTLTVVTTVDFTTGESILISPGIPGLTETKTVTVTSSTVLTVSAIANTHPIRSAVGRAADLATQGWSDVASPTVGGRLASVTV